MIGGVAAVPRKLIDAGSERADGFSEKHPNESMMTKKKEGEEKCGERS